MKVANYDGDTPMDQRTGGYLIPSPIGFAYSLYFSGTGVGLRDLHQLREHVVEVIPSTILLQ